MRDATSPFDPEPQRAPRASLLDWLSIATVVGTMLGALTPVFAAEPAPPAGQTVQAILPVTAAGAQAPRVLTTALYCSGVGFVAGSCELTDDVLVQIAAPEACTCVVTWNGPRGLGFTLDLAGEVTTLSVRGDGRE